MKIVGGSFGSKGSVFFKGGRLGIDGVKKASYGADQVRTATAETVSNKKFGFIGAAIGMILFGGLGFFFAGLFGGLIGVVLAVAGSFYGDKKHFVRMVFQDEAEVTVECSERSSEKLIRFPAK